MEFDYAKAASVIFPDFSKGLIILQVGCGGTGSWLASDIARIVRSLNNRKVLYYICDPDTVEKRNTMRQNFCEAEIGLAKSTTMAARLSHAWGIEIGAIPQPFKIGMIPRGWDQIPTLILGCVDNHVAREQIHRVVTQSEKCLVWWLDCGNHETSGQVLLGNAVTPDQMKKQFPFPGKCARLPAPSVQHPELLEPDTTTAPVSFACADMDTQGLTVNRMVSAIAADYALRLLTQKELKRYATYFDLASMAMTSKYITENG